MSTASPLIDHLRVCLTAQQACFAALHPGCFEWLDQVAVTEAQWQFIKDYYLGLLDAVVPLLQMHWEELAGLSYLEDEGLQTALLLVFVQAHDFPTIEPVTRLPFIELLATALTVVCATTPIPVAAAQVGVGVLPPALPRPPRLLPPLPRLRAGLPAWTVASLSVCVVCGSLLASLPALPYSYSLLGGTLSWTR